jgi:PKD repeat protein
MKRLLNLIRRHPRLFGVAAAIVLAGTAPFALRSSGSADAAAGSAHVPAVASAGLGQSTARLATLATASTTAPRPHTGHGAGTSGHGTPAAAPTSRGVSNQLRRATGLSPSQVTARRLCPSAATGHARCAGETLVLRSTGAPVRPRHTPRGSLPRVTPALGRTAPAPTGPASSAAPPDFGTPAYLQQAYDLSSLSQSAGTGDTVAIVDASDDPTAESDLSAFRSDYGLPPCTTANGCFRKVNQSGGSAPPAYSDPGWVQEISLDLGAVSAICPNCHILLVEANSSKLSDLNAAMQAAHTLGASQISDSWTATASSVPSGTYTFPGVATVAATGDDGYVAPFSHGHRQDNYPAALPGVTAAGGTTLAPASDVANARGFSEGAWVGGGSGCDSDPAIHKPAYQTDTGCSGRSYADLSADADPETGLWVYDNGQPTLIGGTSLATPIIAAYYAITGGASSTPQWAYTNSGAFNDIVSGSNGSCAANVSYICTAGQGYDGPTGVGSISGAAVTGAPGIGGPANVTRSGDETYTQSTRSDGATITAGIYPNGLDTSWSIQYWPVGSVNLQQTPAADLGSGKSTVSVTGYLSHLTPNTPYDYQLVATNSAGTVYGYTYSFTTPSASATAPTAAFTPFPTAAAPGSPVSLDATTSTDSGATITDYRWDFGDGTTQDAGGSPTTSHKYTRPGIYGVTLIVTNSAGESDTTTQTVTVDAAPTASFTASPTFNAPATFDASGSSDSLGTITVYSWNFGDGSPQDAQNTPTMSHTYAARGSYTVTLTVTNDAGQSNTSTQTITVDDGPTLSLDPTPAVTKPNQPVTVNATASSPDAAGTIASYTWDFGDPGSAGNTTTGPSASASHTYATSGTYTVTVTATDDLGVSTTQTGQVTVDASPTASFSASPTQPSPGAAVSLDASGSSDPVGTITGYSWDFGDPGSAGNTATGPTTTHTYLARGSYTVTLTVTNDANQTATSTRTVIVDDAPSVDLSPPTSVTAPNLPVILNATATTDGSIADYRWDFGDPGSAGNTATGPTTTSASHTYTTPGTYPVSVTATDDLGVSTTASGHVTIDATPSASFTASSTQPSPQAQVSFDASGSTDSVGNITDYSWDFGDPGSAGDTASGSNATHTYAARGSYTVTLTVTNDANQTATSTRTVIVDDPPSATLTPSTTLTTPGSTVSFSSVAASPDTGGSITSYNWNFGDPGSAGNTATGAAPSHRYASAGVYTVTLIVTDDLGVSTAKTGHVTVDAAPTAAFTVSSNPVTAGSAVGFDASGSGDSVGTITGYSWNFGDPGSADNTATGRAPNHVYATPGTYAVSLTVTNDAGQSATLTASVTVNSVLTQEAPPTPTPAPVPDPTPTTASTPAPTPPVVAPAPTANPLTATLSAAKKQKLASVLPHGLRVKLAVSQGTTASFQVTLPVRQSSLAGHKTKSSTIVLLRTQAQTLRAGTNAFTLKLSRGATRQFAGTGPLVLTVRVTLPNPAGGMVTRSVKITLTR